MNARATLLNDRAAKDNGGETVIVQATQMRIYFLGPSVFTPSCEKEIYLFNWVCYKQQISVILTRMLYT
jgi:hypothetical protein